MGWHERNGTSVSLCTPHCLAVPAYCAWLGVLCCHNDNSVPHPNRTKDCFHSDLEHELCKGATSITTPAAVWKLDLTMHKLGGSLSDDVTDAVKVLTGHGLQVIDFSRYAVAVAGLLVASLCHHALCRVEGVYVRVEDAHVRACPPS
jgi:hypothetical protein